MSDEELYVCGICRKDIVIQFLDDMYEDESGEYHSECHDEWRDSEAKKWANAYYADKSQQHNLTVQEQIDAYEPGSAKRYAMERELIGN